jgi:hypothetical protein
MEPQLDIIYHLSSCHPFIQKRQHLDPLLTPHKLCLQPKHIQRRYTQISQNKNGKFSTNVNAFARGEGRIIYQLRSRLQQNPPTCNPREPHPIPWNIRSSGCATGIFKISKYIIRDMYSPADSNPHSSPPLPFPLFRYPTSRPTPSIPVHPHQVDNSRYSPPTRTLYVFREEYLG